MEVNMTNTVAEYKIHHDIPMQCKMRSEPPLSIALDRTCPFDKMAVGDSFIVPCDDKVSVQTRTNITQHFYQYRKIAPNFRITTTAIKNEEDFTIGIGVWRLSDRESFEVITDATTPRNPSGSIKKKFIDANVFVALPPPKKYSAAKALPASVRPQALALVTQPAKRKYRKAKKEKIMFFAEWIKSK
jgi:hypothetical protein